MYLPAAESKTRPARPVMTSREVIGLTGKILAGIPETSRFQFGPSSSALEVGATGKPPAFEPMTRIIGVPRFAVHEIWERVRILLIRLNLGYHHLSFRKAVSFSKEIPMSR